jgi:hypothetical protein
MAVANCGDGSALRSDSTELPGRCTISGSSSVRATSTSARVSAQSCTSPGAASKSNCNHINGEKNRDSVGRAGMASSTAKENEKWNLARMFNCRLGKIIQPVADSRAI